MNRLSSRIMAGLSTTLLVVSGEAYAADVWQIDSAHSVAQFAVTHLMISTVRGEFGAMSGTIEYDGKSVASIKADVTIDATSITTRNEYRDNDLKSDHFFDVAKYPSITFKSKKSVAVPSGFQLSGDLTIHGVTKEVVLDCLPPSKIIKGAKGESRVGASGTAKINRQDFGIKWNANVDGGGVVVSDMVSITLDIEALMPPPPPKK